MASKKADNKSQPTEASVEAFLNNVENAQRRKESFVIVDIIRHATNVEPRMWGTSMVGFGVYRYEYKSGREGMMPLIGFSPRKENFTFYFTQVFHESEKYADLLASLGKHKAGKSCLYINKLADVDERVLEALVRQAAEHLAGK